MTTDIVVTGASTAPRPRTHPSVVWTLARLEGRRHLRNPVLWFGVAVTMFSAWQSSAIDWTAGPYTAFPIDAVPAAWALFVLGVVSGGRDHLAGLRPSPGVAVVTGDDRVAIGRLLGLLAPLAVVTAVVAGRVVVAHLGGGYSIGERSWRTTDAQHTLPEIAQPILLAAVCAAAGVAVGRAVRYTIVAVAAGTLVLFVFGLISWAWQWTPAVYVAPVQQQPFSVELPQADPTLAPPGWWLSAPGQYQDGWRRLVVAPVVAVGHDLVLLGACAVFSGWAVRRVVGRVLAASGIGLAVVGVIVQVVAAPW